MLKGTKINIPNYSKDYNSGVIKLCNVISQETS